MEANANWASQSEEVAYNIWDALDIDIYSVLLLVWLFIYYRYKHVIEIQRTL